MQGKMKIKVKNERGMTLTKEHGFTIEETDKVLAFDIIESEEYGITLLFGDQIFFLKFWKDEDLIRAESLIKRAIYRERLSRHENQ